MVVEISRTQASPWVKAKFLTVIAPLGDEVGGGRPRRWTLCVVFVLKELRFPQLLEDNP